MFKLSMFVIYAIIAFNLTAFAILLQLDFLIFNSVIIKLITWLFVIAFWMQAYNKRQTFITIF